MLNREQAQRLLDFLFVPHKLGRPGDGVQIVRLCRGCGEGGLVAHPIECPLIDIIPTIEKLANAPRRTP